MRTLHKALSVRLKGLTTATAILVACVSVFGIAHTSNAQTAPRVGQLVYNPSTKVVYYVTGSGLYGFPDTATFFSWGFTASQVQSANSGETALATVGNVPTKKAGCSTPLDQINNTCGSSGSAASGLTIDSLASSSNSNTVRLVYNPGNKLVYFVGNNGLLGFPSADVFYSWGYTFNMVQPMTGAERSMQMLGIVPAKGAGCDTPAEQVAGTCGANAAHFSNTIGSSQGTPGNSYTSNFSSGDPFGYNGPTGVTGTVPAECKGLVLQISRYPAGGSLVWGGSTNISFYDNQLEGYAIAIPTGNGMQTMMSCLNGLKVTNSNPGVVNAYVGTVPYTQAAALYLKGISPGSATVTLSYSGISVPATVNVTMLAHPTGW